MASSTPEVPLNSSVAAGKTVPQDSGYGRAPDRSVSFTGVAFALRLLLFASSVSALVVLVTSKQTEAIPVLLQPQRLIYVTRAAKFQHSPALIYLVVALAVTSLYSIITLATSAAFISKSAPSTKFLFQLIVLDLLMAGIMASATGSAGSVAYIGVKGNSHVMWNKICNVYDKFCRHVGSSVALSLVASILLVLLVILSSFTIYRRSY